MAREAIVERLLKLDTCAVSDGMDRLGLMGATYGVRPLWSCPKIVGRAVTIKIKPIGLDKPKHHLGTLPIDAAQPGDVIVIDNGGRPDTSCWGGVFALAPKTKEIQGGIVDGACPGRQGEPGCGFPGFCPWRGADDGAWKSDAGIL